MKVVLFTIFVALVSCSIYPGQIDPPQSIDYAKFYPYHAPIDDYLQKYGKLFLNHTQQSFVLRNSAAHTGRYVGAVRNYYDSQKDTQYVNVLNQQYNLNTAENGCKWGATEPNENRFDFTQCDYTGNASLRANSAFRGHNLCWGEGNPNWLLNGHFSGSQLTQFLQNHINTVLKRYGGRYFCWDVVNEAVVDGGTGLKNNVWYPAVPDYIDVAFRAARQADPSTKLFYNDYGGEGMNQKSEQIYNLVRSMKQRGVPIDGVGLQMHVSIHYYPSPSDISANIKRLGALGLDVHITEMDVKCDIPCTAADLQTQANIYGVILTACLENPNCKSFETWGFTDKYSWLNTNNGNYQPLPWDINFNAKPAATTINNVFTNWKGN